MKYFSVFLLGLSIGYLVSVLIDFHKGNEKYKYDFTVWDGITHIPMPEEYRQATGMDSIQFVCHNNCESIKANFCYPNKWERWRYNHDTTVFIKPTYIKDSPLLNY